MNRKVFHALSLALIFGLLVTTVVVADNIQNDVVVGGNDTIIAGGSTTVKYRITANNGDGQNGCNANDGSEATVTINTPHEVIATPGSLDFMSCGVEQAVDFTSTTPGSYEITVSVTDSGIGTYNTNPAKFTLKVLPAPSSSDLTPPVITYILDPEEPDGLNDWFKSDVTLTWTVTEEESPDSLVKVGCDDQEITEDQVEVTYSCSAESDGGKAGPVEVKIKRDATAPTISGSASPAHNPSGWNNTDVTVSFTCDDSLSGVASCELDATLTEEGADQSVTGTAIDHAGNTASDTVSDINIDKTAPVVSWQGDIADGDEFYFGFVPAAPTCEASDALSGPDGCVVSGYDISVGTHTLTATASDKAGNTSEESRTYTVKAWTLSGFYRPVEMAGVWNTVKGGSTVPLKFNIFAGTTELTSTSAVKGFSVTLMSCYGGPEDTVEELATTGGTTLRYDSTAGQFIQNWQTPKSPGKCYRVTMTTQDGSTLSANFKLK